MLYLAVRGDTDSEDIHPVLYSEYPAYLVLARVDSGMGLHQHIF